jgi:hypothetical protein
MERVRCRVGRACWGVELKWLDIMCNGFVVEWKIVRSLWLCHGHHVAVRRTECLVHAIVGGRHVGLVCERVVHCLLLVI